MARALTEMAAGWLARVAPGRWLHRWTATFALALLISLAGCQVPGGPSGFAGTITFGFTAPLTGPDVEEGRYTLDGYQFFVNTVNAQGGLLVGSNHYRVALDYYDDQSNPTLTAQLYQRLITQDNVNFLLGPYSSLLTAAAVPVAERYGVPLVAAHGAADSIYSTRNRYTWSIISPAKDYLRGIIAVALQRDPAIATVALLGSDEPFSREVLAGAQDYATERGLKTNYLSYYPLNPTDMSAQIAAIKALRPDMILVSGHLQDAILFTRQAHGACLSPKVVGMTVGPATQAFRANLGAEANYIFGATQWTSALNYSGDDIWGTPQRYTSAFIAQFPSYTEIPYQVAESTAALVVYQQAVRNAGTLDPTAVADALARIDMMTFYGRIKFDDRGVNIYKPMAVTQLQPDGGDYTVFPQDVAQRAALVPMPPCMGR